MSTKKSTRKYVDLKKYNNTVGQMWQIRKDVLGLLGDELFQIYDSQELVYAFLKRIKQVRTVKNEPASIENAIKKVLQQLRLQGSKSTITNLGTGKTHTSSIDPIQSFNFFIFGLKTPPASHLATLEMNVKEHLKELSDLIVHYETREPLIEEMLAKSRTPSSHPQRVRWDFYQRCLDEQKKILHYYLNEMKDRAIMKSVEEVQAEFGLSGLFGFPAFRDYPYQFGHFYYLEKFDYRHINQSAHRNGMFPTGDGTYERLEQLYSRDKAKYYREYFSIRTKAEILKNMQTDLAGMPLAKKRMPIFDELEKLLRGRRWIAFFALGLPQIEGLFTDMQEIARKDGKGKGSLSEKVLDLREFDQHGGMYFDYFEYHVPTIRNKFMHTGYDEDFELKAYDVLTDLEYLLSAFSQLKAPWLTLHKLYDKRDAKSFFSFQQIVNYLKTLSHLKKDYPKRFRENEAAIREFNTNFLTKDCRIFDHILSKIPDLNKSAQECPVKFEYHFAKEEGVREAFGKLRNPEVIKLLEDEKFPSLFKRFLIYNSDAIEDIEHLKLIHGSSKLFQLDESSNEATVINECWNTNKTFIEKVLALKAELEKRKNYDDL